MSSATAVGKGKNKSKKLKDLKAEKGLPSADDASVDDAPAEEAEAEVEVKEGGEPGTPPVEEVAPEPTAAEPEEAPEVKAPEVKAPPPPVKTKEEPKAVEAKKEPEAAKKHEDHELMHQHPKDCFLTLWPGIVSVFGVFLQPFQRHHEHKEAKADGAEPPAAEAK